MFTNSKKLKSRFKYSSGFTLTEVLVIVLIVAVLTVIAYPLYSKAINKSRAVEAVNLLEIVRTKQVGRYARARGYYADFSNMGQLTTNKSKETASGASMVIGDYTLALNNDKSCMSATYKKGGTEFTFSTSYENAGLGCTGDICASFGNVIGSAKEVCNCGNKTCAAGSLDESTCECKCVSGGSTSCSGLTSSSSCQYGFSSCKDCSGTTHYTCNTCASGGSASCSGLTSSSSCQYGFSSCKDCSGNTLYTCNSAPAQICTPNQSEYQGGCQYCGDQYRVCNSSGTGWNQECRNQGVCSPSSTTTSGCSNGATKTCSSSCSWGSCTGGSGGGSTTCSDSTKPATSQKCGCNNAGTQSRTVTCSNGTWNTSTWGTCSIGACACTPNATEQQSCGTCGKQTRTCASSGLSWGNWGNCNETTKPDTSQKCGCNNAGTQTRTPTCNKSTATWSDGTWGSCSIGACVCTPGATQNQSCGTCKQQTRTCASNGLSWGNWGSCASIQKPDTTGGKCTDCGGTLNCDGTCDCGYYNGVKCNFNATRGCVCGNLVRACR